MTALACWSRRFPLPLQSLCAPIRRGVGLALALCLVVIAGSCSPGQNAPFVQLTLNNLPASAVRLDVDVQLDAVLKTPTPKFTGDAGSLSLVTISFPADARGALTLAVRAFDATPCVVATGAAKIELTANQTYAVAISVLQMTPTAGCQNSMVPLTVAKGGDGQGTITSADGTINCGATCMAQFGPSQLVSLTAAALTAPSGATYKFVKWTGVTGCDAAPTCTFQLNQALTATANFRCSGFCPETPAAQTNTLYGIWGFSTTKIVAVGAGGTVLQGQGDGSWKPVVSGVQANITLRAVHGQPGSLFGFAAGDMGTIISTLDGGTSWSRQTTNVTVQLRGVLTVSMNEAYAVGDNIGSNSPYLQYKTGSWSPFLTGGLDYAWNAVALLEANAYMLVGASGRNTRVLGTSPDAPMIGSSNNLNGTWGTSKTNIFIVGDNSTLLQSNGTTLTPMTPPTAGVNMRALFGFGPTSIYAVGDGGTIWKYTGTWQAVASGGTTANLYAMWGNNETDFYVVGQNGTIVHNRQ